MRGMVFQCFDIAFPPAMLAIAAPLLLAPEVLPTTAGNFVVPTALISCAVAIVLLRRRRLLAFLVTVIAVTAYLGWLRTSHPAETLPHFAGLSFGLLTMSVLASWCQSLKRFEVAVAVFLVGGTVALLVGLASAKLPTTKYLSGQWVNTLRLVPHTLILLPGLDGGIQEQVNANALGATALLIGPLALAMTWRRWSRLRTTGQRWLASVTTLGLQALGTIGSFVAAAALLVSQSRTAWSATLLTLCAAFAVPFVRSRKTSWRLVVLVAVIVTTSLLLATARVIDVDEDPYGAAAGVTSRLDLWNQGLSQLRTAPLMGIGLNEYRYVHTPERPNIGHVHNMFLQTALDLGLVGFSAYLWLLIVLLTCATRSVRARTEVTSHAALGAALVLLGVHAFGVADAVSLGAKVGLFQWWAAGLLLAADQVTTTTDPPGLI